LTLPPDLPALPLPEGIRTRHVDNHNGLTMHVLEAGWQDRTRPALLLVSALVLQAETSGSRDAAPRPLSRVLRLSAKFLSVFFMSGPH